MMTSRTYRKNRRADGGLTLLELIVSLTILVLLGGLVAANFMTFSPTGELAEGATQLETVLRMTRATAAFRGRRFRLTFDADGTLAVLWEPRPLELPGDFVLYGATWFGRLPHTSARVTRCTLIGDSAQRLLALSTGESHNRRDLEAVTFYPDGSSVSAAFELTGERDDSHRAILVLDGQSGRITTQLLEDAEAQDSYEQLTGGRTAPS